MAKKILFVLDPKTLEHIGLVTKYTSISFVRKSKDVGSFELWCDRDDNNIQMAKTGNLIYLSESKVGIIQYVGETVDDKGVKSLDIKGKTVKYYMSYRIIVGTYEATNTHVSDIMQDLILYNFISPDIQSRKFKNMIMHEDSQTGVGEIISMQKTGGEVMDTLNDLCKNYSMCFDVLVDIETRQYKVKIYQGLQRVTDDEKIVVSTDLKDILSSKYTKNSADEKNIALVAGAGDGEDRKTTLIGESDVSGIDRKEMYVDARDLSVTKSVDGEDVQMSDEEYFALLSERGISKLGEQKTIESFDAEIKSNGATNYIYGKDYFLGDTIVALDKKLGVEVFAEVTEEEEVISGKDGNALNVTFGYSQPTIAQKINTITKGLSQTNTSTSEVKMQIKKTASDLINQIYPVGAIYMSMNATNPEQLFGGTWSQINDKFLLSSGSIAAGLTGGVDKNSLQHTHTYGVIQGAYYGSLVGEDTTGKKTTGVCIDGNGAAAGWSSKIGSASERVNNANMNSKGSTDVSVSHYRSTAQTSKGLSDISNMPPYLSVYMWQRIS